MSRDFVIKATKPGYDVTSTDPRDFTIHSAYNMLKIAEEGYGSVTMANTGDQQLVNISHNLGYNPFFRGFYQIDDGNIDYWFPIPGLPYNAAGGGGLGYNIGAGYTYPDTNTVRITFDSLGNNELVVPYKYYVFIDPYKEAWYE